MNIYNFYLRYISQYDILKIDLPLSYDMFRESVLKNHDRIISYDEKKMLFRTYLDNSKMITAKTLEHLEDKLIEYYSINGNGKIFYFPELFRRACVYNLEHEFLAPSTINRYYADAEKYLFKSPYFNKDIRDIIERDICDFFVDVMESRPTSKCVRNIKTAIKFCFSYARMQERIDCCNINSILHEVKFPKNAFKPIIYQDRVLYDEHIEKLQAVLSDSDVDFGILFLFYTGLRIGELCALRCDDFNFKNNYLTVQRTESISRKNNKRVCSDVLPKCNKIRNVYLSDTAVEIAQFLIRGKTGFIFPKNDTHLHIDVFDHRLRRLCQKCDIPSFSVHDILA